MSAAPVDEPWTLPGYEVLARLPGTATHDRWRARELATGETVCLERVEGDVAAAAVDALHRDVQRLDEADPGGAHRLRLRAVVHEPARAVLVLDHPAGGPLDALLARRGSLAPGEVVTIAVPLGQTLATAHAHGVLHGGLDAGAVWFTGDGRPLLAGFGTRHLGAAAGARSGAPAGAPDDVAALAALCTALLGPGAPPVLARLLDRGQASDPSERPDAAGFAARLRTACPAAAVRLVGVPGPRAGPAEGTGAAAGGGGGARRAGRGSHAAPARAGRRTPSGRMSALGVVLLLLCGAAAGWSSGRGGEQPAPTSRPAVSPAPSAGLSPSAGRLPAGAAGSSSTVDWLRVVDRLDAARAAAFARADAGALTAVYVPRSPGMAADRRLLDELRRAGRTAHAVRHTLRSATLLTADADRVRVRVVGTLRPYELRDARGAVRGRVPGRGDAAHVLALARGPAGWRLVEVVRD